MSTPFIEDNDQTRARREHLEAIGAIVGNVYPNKFERSRATGDEDTITAIVRKFKEKEPQAAGGGGRPSQEELDRINSELNRISVRTSGRIATPPRVMGKAAFVHLSDGVSRLQIYVRQADVRAVDNDRDALIDEEGKGWELFNLLDHGDFIGVEGFLFVTKTGELSIHVRELQFLAKALLPMPDKLHGLTDPEIRQRQRYADLIAGSLKVKTDDDEPYEMTPREIFELRSRVIRELRRFLDEHGYIEVETPMLTPLATGAAAKPFVTHHNALGIDLYARIAPELYLKRLLVGGFEKVYELNRNFRNEGIGYRWNPEFTMLEFYCAYMDANGMMDFCEEMLQTVIERVTGNRFISRDAGNFLVSTHFARLSMKQAIAEAWAHSSFNELLGQDIDEEWLDDAFNAQTLAAFLRRASAENSQAEDEQAAGLETEAGTMEEYWRTAEQEAESALAGAGDATETRAAQDIVEIFETLVEPSLLEPTFITDFPKPISPLSKASPVDPSIAERFELFIRGMEIANGFSELNDPVEQRERFLEQMLERERGDEEAMVLDEDYIRALSYGMPPAAGIGIGIDRLVMVLTNKHTIREVILFPHMRPERKARDSEEESPDEK